MTGKGRQALPLEAQEQLSDEQLIATLRLLEGETVCLKPELGEGRSRLTILGELSLYDYGEVGQGVAVGSARLLLAHDGQITARLATYDGNDYFQIVMKIDGAELVIGDTALVGTDEFE